MRCAAWEGTKAGAVALLASFAAVTAATKAFPRFNKSLTVSSKTALIASPMFAAFALYGELELNDCARRNRRLKMLGNLDQPRETV